MCQFQKAPPEVNVYRKQRKYIEAPTSVVPVKTLKPLHKFLFYFEALLVFGWVFELHSESW